MSDTAQNHLNDFKDAGDFATRIHKNPLLNYLICRIMDMPEFERRARSYHRTIVQEAALSDGLPSKDQNEPRAEDILRFLCLCLEELDTRWELNDPGAVLAGLAGQERPVLLVANHPLGGRDGIALLECMAGFWGVDRVKALVNEFLLRLPYIRELFLPISPFHKDKRMAQMRRLNETLEQNIGSQTALLLFAAGLCSRWHPQPLALRDEWPGSPGPARVDEHVLLHTWQPLREIYDLPWHHSFVRLARKHGLSILPVHISGRNSPAFYRLARLRLRLGLRFGWEMLLLPREFLYNHQDERRHIHNEAKCRLTITPGAPLSHQTIRQWSPRYDSWRAQAFKHYVYQLPQWNDPNTARTHMESLGEFLSAEPCP